MNRTTSGKDMSTRKGSMNQGRQHPARDVHQKKPAPKGKDQVEKLRDELRKLQEQAVAAEQKAAESARLADAAIADESAAQARFTDVSSVLVNEYSQYIAETNALEAEASRYRNELEEIRTKNMELSQRNLELDDQHKYLKQRRIELKDLLQRANDERGGLDDEIRQKRNAAEALGVQEDELQQKLNADELRFEDLYAKIRQHQNGIRVVALQEGSVDVADHKLQFSRIIKRDTKCQEAVSNSVIAEIRSFLASAGGQNALLLHLRPSAEVQETFYGRSNGSSMGILGLVVEWALAQGRTEASVYGVSAGSKEEPQALHSIFSCEQLLLLAMGAREKGDVVVRLRVTDATAATFAELVLCDVDSNGPALGSLVDAISDVGKAHTGPKRVRKDAPILAKLPPWLQAQAGSSLSATGGDSASSASGVAAAATSMLKKPNSKAMAFIHLQSGQERSPIAQSVVQWTCVDPRGGSVSAGR
eukprot:gnl/MRDRNA2_/MRDRNA2_27376_c0_seq1.p1 gnl/MRDRNA2_/MRDRNA2_27376_c0~~gnl/MRDRNA2_/MRDRNA2_27376_c0_seq1.p1  ORF type:complete len:476 (-),score=131.48 gnl/MRDRNA2_/MRDRNA2_27376_c0_seq1:44-1471(-)